MSNYIVSTSQNLSFWLPGTLGPATAATAYLGGGMEDWYHTDATMSLLGSHQFAWFLDCLPYAVISLLGLFQKLLLNAY